MSWSEASTWHKNEQTAEANIECPVGCRLSPVTRSKSPKPKAKSPKTPLSWLLVGSRWYLLSIAAAWRQITLWQSKYKLNIHIDLCIAYSDLFAARRKLLTALNFFPWVRAYTKRLLKLAKHLPKFSYTFFLFSLFFQFVFSFIRFPCTNWAPFLQTVDSWREVGGGAGFFTRDTKRI